jgi:hypothetical protein
MIVISDADNEKAWGKKAARFADSVRWGLPAPVFLAFLFEFVGALAYGCLDFFDLNSNRLYRLQKPVTNRKKFPLFETQGLNLNFRMTVCLCRKGFR